MANLMRRISEVTPRWYATGDPTTAPPPSSFQTDYGTAGSAGNAVTPLPGVPGAPAAPGSDGGSGAPGGGPVGSLNIPGYNPDYNQLLLSDPAYLAWANSHPGVVADANTRRQAAIRALAMQYGGLPEGFTDSYGDLSDEDLAAAKANPYSDVAQLQSQYENNLGNLRRTLAARGQLHSGDLGYGQGLLDTQLGKSQYDLSSQFSKNLADVIGGYTDSLHNDELAGEGAIGQAYQDVVANPSYQPTADTQASLVPTWQTDYGVPVYKTGDGRLYTVDANGNPVLYTG